MRESFVETTSTIEVVNVTGIVSDLFAGMGKGVGFVFSPHTTAALIVSEDDPPDLRADIELVASSWLEGIGPFRHAKNDNPNTVAHVLSAFGGTSVSVPVRDGALDLGTYQSVLLLELDGPKQRTLRFAFVASTDDL